MEKIDSRKVCAGDVVLLPGALTFVRIEGVSYPVTGGVRLTYSNINSGANIRSRTVSRGALVTLHPQFGKVVSIHG
jgi:hypothetical protein